jgi:hypothetical protein
MADSCEETRIGNRDSGIHGVLELPSGQAGT